MNGAMGFGMLLALLFFCLGDIEKALHHPAGLPFMGIFEQATRSISGTSAMASIIIVMSQVSGLLRQQLTTTRASGQARLGSLET
jgi:hypothetical protein